MSGRADKLGAEDQASLAVEIRKARRQGVPWKVLARVYNRSRAQMWRYLRQCNTKPAQCNICAVEATTEGMAV
jgi:hypothetical protein